ncbi:MAG: L-histidine N(alpha)-methyltransferase [Alphaproteobacteria bacterium]|nr:L-histidine N(alpha)-methyltransferase [Alphaproteobacteria bacterium]MBL6952464.1 L-histidine N(alpha)-methyltransferase [Alphaproteobacteria bacterium]
MTNGTTVASFTGAQPAQENILDGALAGLGATPKTLPSKYFYDERGSKLFELICELPEYYVTRVETALLGEFAGQAAALMGDGASIIEFGTGSSEKIGILLGALERPAAFVAVDISPTALRAAAETMARDFPNLAVHGVCADFTQPVALPEMPGAGRRVVFFPGSSLGNFNPEQSVDFLANAARLIGPGGGMLIGIDVKKDEAILNAAYDDAQGVTAAFNLNLLRHLNRECGANFDLDAFSHRAFYNAGAGRVEMHLVSLHAQTVTLGGQSIAFAEGETIHTENSYKYSIPEFQDLARRAGCEPVRAWTDAEGLFSLHYLSVASDPAP